MNSDKNMTTEGALKLLPCPFCGLDVTDDEGCFPINRERTRFEVRCGNPSCFAHEPSDESYSAAIARWNSRTQQAEWLGLSDEIMQALREARDTAMHYTMAARIPECGEFGGIAQNLDYVLQEIEAGRAWRTRAPMELTDGCGWELFLALEKVLAEGDNVSEMDGALKAWLAERSEE